MRPGIRLLIPPQESDPLGEYIAGLIAEAGLSEDVAAKRARGEISEHLPSLRQGLTNGGVDAALIYTSTLMLDAFVHLGTPVLLSSPFEMSDRIIFGAGAIERNGLRNAVADTFVSYLTGSDGQARLVATGFLQREKALQNLERHW